MGRLLSEICPISLFKSHSGNPHTALVGVLAAVCMLSSGCSTARVYVGTPIVDTYTIQESSAFRDHKGNFIVKRTTPGYETSAKGYLFGDAGVQENVNLQQAIDIGKMIFSAMSLLSR